MRILLGLIAIAGALLNAGQLLTVVSFRLVQRLGLQEHDDGTDPLHRRLERNTARWDQATLWLLPLASLLIRRDHPAWPALALIGSDAYFDTGGREAAKFLGLEAEGVRVGSPSEQRIFRWGAAFISIAGLVAALCGWSTLNARYTRRP